MITKLEQVWAALNANHAHHRVYDTYDGYESSNLCETNTKALALVQELINAAVSEMVVVKHEDICGDEVGPPTVLWKSPPSEGLTYGIIDPDYARVFTQARIVAWQYGYACLMHGSFTRDLDLLLVPWTVQAKGNDEQLFKLIAQATGLRFKDGETEIHKAKVDFSDKPHGRLSCSLYFPNFGDKRWVDFSVITISVMSLPLVKPRKFEPLRDDDIQTVFDSMPGGLEGFLKGWGWKQFARAIEALTISRGML
jgi:hypothetical protein